MRILHLCLGNFFIDNYSYQENMLAKYHVRQGHDVTVIASLFTFGENGEGRWLDAPSSYQASDGYRVIRLGFKKPLKWNRFFRHYEGLYAALEETDPDVIFSHNVSYGDTGVVARYLNAHPKVRLFADNHADFVNSAKNRLSRRILHPVIWRHYAQKLVPYLVKCYGVTPMRCRFLKEMYHIPSPLVEYLPMGVDDDLIPADRIASRRSFREEHHIPQDAFVVVTGGKIDRLKNTHVLLDALEKMDDPSVHLLLCGVLTPEMMYLKERIERNASVHDMGWCDAARVMACMNASDLACFPGTHSTLWEQAVGLGLPGVFKRWPEMEHVNVNGNCLFVKGEDVDELSEVLRSLVSGDVYATLLGRAAEASGAFQYSRIAARAIGKLDS